MSQIKVNGKVQETDVPLTLTALIKQNKVQQPSMISVQLNGKFVNRENFDITEINEGDEVDFLYFMGGGQYC